MNKMDGVLVLHKPAKMTSHDCVARIRRLFQSKKVGHTGTLDPDVTGVLPICIGQATRIVEYLQELPKAYDVVMRLGSTTTTEDASGDVLEEKEVDPSQITVERVQSVFRQFLGEIDQIPPMYSAVKIQGKRLYDLAREGKVIERQARKVTIYELLLHDIKQDSCEISFTCRCSKGTYIRTLCVDIGKELGFPAHMAHLVRVQSGPFTQKQAISLEDLEQKAHRGEDLTETLIPIADALSFLPHVEVEAERKKAVLNGLETALPGSSLPEGSLIRLFSGGELLGLHRVCYGHKGAYAKPDKVFQP